MPTIKEIISNKIIIHRGGIVGQLDHVQDILTSYSKSTMHVHEENDSLYFLQGFRRFVCLLVCLFVFRRDEENLKKRFLVQRL